MLRTAQANGRYPNFGGFCRGVRLLRLQGGRPADAADLLAMGKSHGAGDSATSSMKTICSRPSSSGGPDTTGSQPEEYINYLLCIRRPDMAPIIDLPTKHWLEETAARMPALPAEQLAPFEKRLDAWSAFLDGALPRYVLVLYGRRCGRPTRRCGRRPACRSTMPPRSKANTFRRPTRRWISATRSTWNDQIGTPDYCYQWLFTAGLLNMERPDGPADVDQQRACGRFRRPGRFSGKIPPRCGPHPAARRVGDRVRVRSLLRRVGRRGRASAWAKLRGGVGQFDVEAGRRFIDRFACLATEGRGGYGVRRPLLQDATRAAAHVAGLRHAAVQELRHPDAAGLYAGLPHRGGDRPPRVPRREGHRHREPDGALAGRSSARAWPLSSAAGGRLDRRSLDDLRAARRHADRRCHPGPPRPGQGVQLVRPQSGAGRERHVRLRADPSRAGAGLRAGPGRAQDTPSCGPSAARTPNSPSCRSTAARTSPTCWLSTTRSSPRRPIGG